MPIQIVRPQDRDVKPINQNADISGAEGISEEAMRVVGRQVIQRSAPHVHLSKLPPNRVGPVHSHSTTEVMIVLEGAVTVNDTLCEVGTVAVIPAHERYGIEASDEGVMFAIVRSEPGTYSDHAGQ